MLTVNEKIPLYRQLLWDYNISQDELKAFILKKKTNIGHYSHEQLMKKVFESYSWYTVLDLYSKQEILDILNDEFIQKLKTPSLRKNYAFIRKRLQETI